MPTDRFMIAPINTGLETDLRPWMIPDDAFSELNNAYVFRGRVRKRFGGQLMRPPGGVTQGYEQLTSRLRINIGNTPGPLNIPPNTAGALQIGQMFSVGDRIFTVYQLGAGVVTYSTDAAVTCTIDSVAVPNTVTFVGAPAATAVYYYPANPVMGLITYETPNVNNEPVFAFDTKFAYQYTSTGWDVLGPVPPAAGSALWSGTNAQYFWGSTYRGAQAYENYLFITNFNAADQIYYWTGATWVQTAPIFNAAGDTIRTARLIVPFKDRLVLLNTVEKIGGTDRSFVNRCRFSQNGDPVQTTAGAEAFREDVPGKGGYVDAPTKEAIVTCQFLKDRLIVYFESSTWELVYTGNEILPFRFQQINTELGAESTFSQVPFDKVVLGVGNVGIHACNGSNVERIDQKIPDSVFAIHNVDDGVERVNGIRDYYVEMVYWTFPAINKSSSAPFCNRVLVYNYKNGSWAFNDDSITVFGYYQPSFGVTWGLAEETWEDSEEVWASGELEARFRNVIAGNQEGFVFIVQPDKPDNCPALQITDISFTPGIITLKIINHNLYVGDYILIDNCQGITGLNTKIYQVISGSETSVDNITIIDANVSSGTYKGAGTVQRVSQIDISTKQFNFYVDKGRNANINKIDFLVDRTKAGKITVDIYPSSGLHATQSLTLETSPYALYPYEQFQDRLWHPIYTSAEGEFIQLNIYLNDAQMKNHDTAFSDFELHAMTFYANPTSARLQ